MKNLIFTTCLIVACAAANAQWPSSGGSPWFNGNVGIGNGSGTPSDQLEVVNGNRKIGFNTSISGLSNPPGGIISLSRPGDGAKIMYLGGALDPTNDHVIFGAGGSSEMRLISGGLSSSGFGFYTNVTLSDAFAGSRPANPVLKIDGSGKVGIGAPSSGALLDIKSGGTPHLYLSTSRPYGSSRNWGIGGNWNTEGDFAIVESTTNSTTPSVTRLAIDVNGNVGIGATPDAKLTVNGTIHAREVRVDLNISGPDYVFEKDYKLLSLEEIKSYVDQHKHLPEVPSAKEMETNGVNVSEMNMLLLKKIEELTLYILEQQKRIEVLEQRAKD